MALSATPLRPRPRSGPSRERLLVPTVVTVNENCGGIQTRTGRRADRFRRDWRLGKTLKQQRYTLPPLVPSGPNDLLLVA